MEISNACAGGFKALRSQRRKSTSIIVSSVDADVDRLSRIRAELAANSSSCGTAPRTQSMPLTALLALLASPTAGRELDEGMACGSGGGGGVTDMSASTMVCGDAQHPEQRPGFAFNVRTSGRCCC